MGALEAINLSKAIEKTLDLLLRDKDQFTWQHRAFNDATIEMRAEKTRGKWQAGGLSSTLEAALSLWLFSVGTLTGNLIDFGPGDSPESKSRESDGNRWLVAEETSLILVDSWSFDLVKDLYYWLPAYTHSSVVALDDSKDNPSMNRGEIKKHRIVGLGGRTPSTDGYGVEKLWDLKEQPKNPMIIAAEVSTSLTSLYTQHIYAVFLEELSKALPAKISNDQPSWWENKANTSQLTGTMSNNTISELVHYLQSIQLFTPEESYFAIISALSRSKRLVRPEVDVRDTIRDHHHDRRLDQVAIKLLFRLKDHQSLHFEHAPEYLRADLTKRICAVLWSSVNLVPSKYFCDYDGNEGYFFLYQYRRMKQFRLPYSKDVVRAVENWGYKDARRLLTHFMLSYDWQSRLDPNHHIRAWPLYANVQKEPLREPYHLRMLDYCGHGKLHQAFRNGSQDEIDAALAAGACIGERDIWGWSVLHYAAALMSSDTDTRFSAAVSVMEANPSLIMARDMVGWTPLHYAARNPNAGLLLDRLLEKSKPDDYDVQSTIDSSTPLHCAAEAGLGHHILKLRDFGLTQKWFDHLDHLGFTPLHRAIVEGHVEASRAILAIVRGHWKTEDYQRQLQQQWTYMHFAVWSGKREILESFPLNNPRLVGDLITWADSNGLTPLHMAVASGKMDVVEALVKRFANDKDSREQLNREDEGRYTPLDIARQLGLGEICTLLEKAGAKPGNPNPDTYVLDREDLTMRIPGYLNSL